ncbi:hypothetical protein I203_105084 [Kwoniella mangroviensis CBS 8507]|uniref:uncharacterized protein n=1 Tax=Kwoniella mangroviensis CBS 8507 TaxID=1296122 RepID=UPI00080CF414|nr:uncharacterized protein I203_08482 [Kwoniella mangroviensis CBS 8507]OCF62446.1 hypothetical protein I203_08482 [Kwoniella mangroviensis CBS 8507]
MTSAYMAPVRACPRAPPTDTPTPSEITAGPQAGPSTLTPMPSSFPDSTTKPTKVKTKKVKIPKPQPSKPELKPKPKPVPVGPFDRPAEEEEKNVHEVYEAIAGHFSQTRHKPWPFIQKFLHSLPPNSIGLDSGAGNGKYLPSSRDARLEMIALDRSSGLLEIARNENGGECVRADLGFNGWRRGVFDFAISIAAIHHLSTPERRRHAIKSLIRPLKLSCQPSYSKFMIYVWAYEQGTLSKRKMGTLTNSSPGSTPIPSTSHPGLTTEPAPKSTETEATDAVTEVEEKIQDLLVPWVYSRPPPAPGPKLPSSEDPKDDDLKASQTEEKAEAKVYHRYYHLFVQGELRELVIHSAEEDGFIVLSDGTSQDELDEQLKDIETGKNQNKKKWLRVRGVGWEADNWWIEGEVGLVG